MTGSATATPPRSPAARAGGTASRTTARTTAPRRVLRAPAWLDDPMTSSHLVLGAGGMLLAIGLVMVFSASAVTAAMNDEPAWAPGVQQVVFAGMGLLAMVVALYLPVRLIRRWVGWALLASLASLALVLVVGVRLNGARQWFDLGFALLQPSEIAKLVVALWGAHVLATRDSYLTIRTLLMPILPLFGAFAFLLMLEPDFGAVISLGLVVAGLLWAGGLPLRYWAGLIAVAAVAIWVLITVAPYRAARITAFLHPFSDPTDGGYQAIHGFYALATGGLWGVGLGNSRMKWNLLPHAQSDYIFAIIGEELGFLGCVVVIGLYGVLAYAGFRIARRSADRFVQVASVAITVWLIGQATMNMGYVVGLLPVTGVQLPLISAGGTSLVLTLFIIGLLARFARSEPQAVEWGRTTERSRLARWLLPIPARAVDTRHVRRPAADPRGSAPRASGRSASGRSASGRSASGRSASGRGEPGRGEPGRAAAGRPDRAAAVRRAPARRAPAHLLDEPPVRSAPVRDATRSGRPSRERDGRTVTRGRSGARERVHPGDLEGASRPARATPQDAGPPRDRQAAGVRPDSRNRPSSARRTQP